MDAGEHWGFNEGQSQGFELLFGELKAREIQVIETVSGFAELAELDQELLGQLFWFVWLIWLSGYAERVVGEIEESY